MWAEIPMFRSFEKSVYTTYLHLPGGDRSNDGRTIERGRSPVVRRTSVSLVSHPPCLAAISRERATCTETRAVHPPRRLARAQPRITGGETQLGGPDRSPRGTSPAAGATSSEGDRSADCARRMRPLDPAVPPGRSHVKPLRRTGAR